MSQTVVITQNKEQKIFLKIKNKRKIKWHPKVIDNEHMDKKKSKCCCQHPSKCNGDHSHH